MFDAVEGGVERVDELAQLRWQRRQMKAPGEFRWCEFLCFVRQFAQRLETDPRDPEPQQCSQYHAHKRQADQGDQQLVLRCMEVFGIDGDHEAQRWALVLGRELADQRLEWVLEARQQQIAFAGRPLREGTDLRIGIAVLIVWVTAHHPKTNALVFLAQQLEFGGDFCPVVRRAKAIDRGLQHAVPRIQLGARQQPQAPVHLLVERTADQHEDQQRYQREHPAQAQRNGVSRHCGSPARNPCHEWCAAVSVRMARRAWRAGA